MRDTNIYEFFYSMPAEEFENKFLDLSRTDEFSAVASGAGNARDASKVKNALNAAGVCAEWLGKDELFYSVIHHITARIINKKTT